MFLVSLRAVVRVLVCLVAFQAIAATKTKLEGVYKDFYNGPASLLMTKAEAESFQRLTTDTERDNFISSFWELRNPTPGIENNQFKEEFYRRVAYANAYYGKDAGSLGWRTDRGKTYVLFGKPQTTMNYIGNQELYATELWFYSNPGLAELPSFFYVLFYEPDGVGGYRVFKPYVDGPEKLMRSGGASRAQAYNYLNGVSAELAHATLTYIPGEPVDTETYTGSMHSMLVVNAVQNYAEMPSYIQQIAVRRARFERVTSHIEFDREPAKLDTFVAMQGGKYWLHWRMQVNEPFQSLKDKDARWQVKARLFAQGRLVYEQSDSPSFPLPPFTAAPSSAGTSGAPQTPVQPTSRPAAYADLLPVEVGKYQLGVELKNLNTGAVYESSREIECRPLSDTVAISDLLVVAKHQPEQRRRPFQFSGVAFTPSAGADVDAVKGLPLLYQVILPANRPKSLVAHYVIAEASLHSRKTIDEELNLKGVDASGTLLVSRTLQIPELSAGNYRVSLRIEDKATGRSVGNAIPFRVVNEITDLNPIAIARNRAENSQSQAAEEYERALCLLAQDQASKAIAPLTASWQLSNNPVVGNLLNHLKKGALAEGNKSINK